MSTAGRTRAQVVQPHRLHNWLELLALIAVLVAGKGFTNARRNYLGIAVVNSFVNVAQGIFGRCFGFGRFAQRTRTAGAVVMLSWLVAACGGDADVAPAPAPVHSSAPIPVPVPVPVPVPCHRWLKPLASMVLERDISVHGAMV